MTLTIEQDCSKALIADAYLAEMIANPGIYEIDVEITPGCGGTVVEATYDEGDDVWEGDDFRFLPTMVSQTVAFTDGIYNISINRRTIIGGAIVPIRACVFLDCTIRCSVITYYAGRLEVSDPNARLVVGYLAALRDLAICGECSCEKACLIYEHLTELLGEEADCGCN